MFDYLDTGQFFLENPTKEYNVREIARLLKINPATASKRLKYLKEKKILKHRKERTYDLYQADIESTVYRDLKIYYNIRKVRSSGLIEELNKFYLKPTIILFGSMATGYDNEDSDLDLVIISERKKEFELIERFEKKINKSIQLFIVKNIKELKNQHLINNVLSGIVLQGEIKWT
jgi:predicted nucleotidyltransferase